MYGVTILFLCSSDGGVGPADPATAGPIIDSSNVFVWINILLPDQCPVNLSFAGPIKIFFRRPCVAIYNIYGTVHWHYMRKCVGVICQNDFKVVATGTAGTAMAVPLSRL